MTPAHILAAILLVATSTACSAVGEQVEGPASAPKGEITKRITSSCAAPIRCGSLAFVDCGQAYDGLAYYYDIASGRILGHCGGYCMGPGPDCETSCPPPAWSCQPR